MADVVRHIGDTGPPITATLNGPSGSVEDLTGATVVLHRKRLDTNAVTQGAGTVTVTDAANGAVSYAMDAGDNATEGSYQFWFTATLSGGEVRSYTVYTWQVLR